MKILVTGAAGFIGFHVCKRLLEEKHEVIGIDNFDPGYNPRLKEENINLLKNYQDFHFINIDLLDDAKVELIFTNFEINKIIHLAARAGVRTSVKIPFSYVDYNIRVTNMLLEYSVRYGIKDFIFGSSSSVYGNGQGPFNEDDVVHPISPYAVSKRACELYGFSYSSLYNMNFTALRFFTVYGPHQRTTMAIARFIEAIIDDKSITIYGDGTARRDFTYIDDIVDGIMLSLNRMNGFKIYNLGRGRTISINELIHIIEEELQKRAKVVYQPKEIGDVELTHANISKAKEELNYEPKISIKEGIKKYILWYLKKHQIDNIKVR
ncbi:MAG: NAD-dependent epimerase/dehydratase family protein [Candidatus Heimdallarchaeaceae archaeon]